MRTPVPTAVCLAATLSSVVAASASSVPDIPVEFHDGLIWVPVRTRGSAAPLNFLLDSGAGVSVINLTTAHKLGLNQGRQVTVLGVQGTTAGFWPVQLPATVHSVPLPRNLLGVDLHEFSRACACPVDGLLGADFFRQHTVQIDFVGRKIRLWPPGRLAQNTNTIALRRHNQAWLAPIRIDGDRTRWVRLDTGCAAALHLVAPGSMAGKSTDTRIAVALTRISVPVIQTSVRFGPREFKPVPAGVHPSAIFAGEAGLLGNGLLSQFNTVTVDARSLRLLLD